MMKEPPYWRDPLKDSFVVAVVSSKRKDGRVEATIQEKVIRPAGGGQAGDRGKLKSGDTTAEILDTASDGDNVTLVLDKEIQVSEQAVLTVDLEWRRAMMRNHTAEHLFVSSLKNLHPSSKLGYIWIDGEQGTVDIENIDLNLEDIFEAEKEVIRIIRHDVPVVTELIKTDNLGDSIRAREGVSEKHDYARVVHIEDFDSSACSGTHVLNTGDIGIFKVVDFRSVENGMRITFKTGIEAGRILTEIYNQVLERKHDFPYEMEQIGAVLDKARQEKFYAEQTKQLVSELISSGSRTEEIEGISFVHEYLPGFDSSDMKHLAKEIISESKIIILLFSPGEKSSFTLWVNNLQNNASHYIADKVIELGGRGGGSDNVYTGGFANVSDPRRLYDTLIDHLKQQFTSR